MEFENRDARRHFLNYALVSKCKSFSKDQREKNIEYLVEGIDPPEDIEKNFYNAMIGCESIAKKRGLKSITKDVIDKWFLEMHNQFSSCKAYKGIVIWRGETKAKVMTAADTERKYKTKIKPSVEIGSRVIVHNDYIIDVVK